uniref:G_PROTEIN_RECEP_F1_2 domain-containing protein n=1 Tax=Panagrellus redivivus TaxID=6233 RepID=A0A7E4VPE6_PANRE
MGVYKHLLFLEVIMSYVITVISFGWQPVFLCPFRAGYCVGPLCWDRVSNYACFQAFLISALLIVHIHSMKIIYQLAITYRTDTFVKRAMTNVKFIYGMFIGMVVFSVVLTSAALLPAVLEIDPHQTSAVFIQDVPALAELIARESTFGGFHPDFNKSSMDLILNIAFSLTAVCPVLIFIICALFYYKMRQLQQLVSAATYAVHVMMLRTMMCETVIKVMFVATPCFFFATTIKFELIWGSYTATPAFAVFMMHLFLESLTLLYFIKPYRSYVKWLMLQKSNLRIHTSDNFAVVRARTSSFPLTELAKTDNSYFHKRLSLFTLKDIPLSELHHPNINNIVHISYFVLIFVNTICCGLMMYIVWYKSSKAMGAYKHLLFLEIILSYIITVILFLWQPILLCPLRAGYCVGPLCQGRLYNYFGLQLFIISSFLIINIHTMKVNYQIAITYHTDSFFKRSVTNVKSIYCMFFTTVVFAFGSSSAVLIPALTEINVNETNAAFIQDVPALMELITTEPTFGGFHPDFNKTALDLILNIIFGVTAVCPVFVAAICTLFYYKMKQFKQHVSAKTYAVHVMMLRTMVFETAIKIAFLATPCFFFALTIKFELLWGSYTATPAFAVFMMPLFFESLILMYFIKPYQNYVKWFVLRKPGLPSRTGDEVTVVRVTTKT